jgi:hypothetical protein
MLSAKAANRKDLSAKPATMTHQHFRQIAAILRTIPQPDALAVRFADELAATNPRFDRTRFLAACRSTEDGR